jgi:hypothetical protein
MRRKLELCFPLYIHQWIKRTVEKWFRKPGGYGATWKNAIYLCRLYWKGSGF